MKVRVSLFIGALLLWSLPVAAQITTGRILGVIQDESQAVLPGVTITLSGELLPGGAQVTVTDAAGAYQFSNLAPGETYALRVELPGFSTYEETGLVVMVNSSTERTVTLPLASVSETITVSGQSPTVDTRQSGIVQSLPDEVIETAATERYGIQAYMTMVPGVTASNLNRVYSFNVLGSNNNETTIMTDGVSINNVRSGGSWMLADFDGAEEMNFTTSGPSVEYQKAGGGVMSLVGKSGTNQFHGDGSAIWGPNALTSSPLVLDCNCPDGKTGFIQMKDRDWGAHIGGPIFRDRSWFFGGGIYRGEATNNPGSPPIPDSVPYLDVLFDMNHKFTWKVSENVHFQQTYYAEIWRTLLPSRPTTTRPLETVLRSKGNDPHIGTQIRWTMNNSAVLTAMYSRGLQRAWRESFTGDITTPRRQDTSTGVWSGPWPWHQQYPVRDQINVKVNQYLSSASVTQNIGYGVQIFQEKSHRADIATGGVVFFDFEGQPDEAEFRPVDYRASRTRSQGFWFEDELTFGNRVTVRGGVRYDHMVGFSQDIDELDITFEPTGNTIEGLGHMVTWNAVSPRGGVSVKLTDDGKTVLRATGGRYYLPLYMNQWESLHPGRATNTRLGWNPATAAYDILLRQVSLASDLKIDKDSSAPYSDQLSVGFDREIANNVSASVSYTHKNSKNLIDNVDVGSVFGFQDTVLADGSTVTARPRLTPSSSISLLRTNVADYYNTYNGVTFSLRKRYADRWSTNLGYTYARTKGLQSGARDPNDAINRDGGLGSRDKPHQFTLLAQYEIPVIGTQFAANLRVFSGNAISSQTRLALPQGRRTIWLEEPGSKFRTPRQEYLHLRITKILFRQAARRLELTAEIRNALQETGSPSIASLVFDASNFLDPSSYPSPRQMRLMARMYF